MVTKTGLATRFAAAVVAGLGLLLVVAGAAEVFVGRTADRVANLVRPELMDKGLAQHRRDFETVTALVEGFDGEVVPAIATELGVSESQLRGEITQFYPDVTQLLQQKDVLLPFAEQGLINLERQQEDFENADSLPPFGLPGHAGGLVNIVLGLVVFGCGFVVFSRSPQRTRRQIAAVALVAALLVAAPIALQVPQKAQSAQRVLDSLNPTSEVAERTDSAFQSARAGQIELQAELWPDLAKALGLNEEELSAAIAENFPETADAIEQMPEITGRYQTRVNIRHDGAPDLRRLKGVPVGLLGWFDPAFGVVLWARDGLGTGVIAKVTRTDFEQVRNALVTVLQTVRNICLPLAVASLMFVGCSGGSDDAVSLPLYRGEPNGDSAALSGTLVVDGRCLYLETASGERYLPAFPESATKWDANTDELTLVGQSVKSGQKVMFGGSQNTRPVAAIDWKVAPLDACETGRIWMAGALMVVEP